MKKLEVKKVTAKSAFKITLYFAVIPVVLMILGGIIALIFGIATGSSEVLIIGGVYSIFPVVMFFLYGAFGALFALIYNVLSNKFGGLEIVVDEEDVDAYDI